MAKKSVVLSSQEDAWKLIRDLGTAKTKAENIILEFKNFPKLEIEYKGGQFHGTLPYRALRAIEAVQDDVYRAYSLANYGDANHSLSKEEKDSLEIVVQVSEGSSFLKIELGDQAQKMMDYAIQRMEPWHVIVIVSIFAVSVVAPKIIKQLQETKRKKIDADKEKQRSEEETKRIQALAEVISKQGKLADKIDTLLDISVNTSAAIAKVARKEGDTVIAGDFDEMDPSDVKTEFKISRERKSDEIVVTREFRVTKIAWKKDLLTRQITIEDDGNALVLDVPSDKDEAANALFEAFKTKTPIKLTLKGKKTKIGGISKAEILEVE